jgi:RNA-directed DNA polymerase
MSISKRNLNIAWNDVDWPLVQSRVRRVQCRIYKASTKGNKQQVRWLQKHLIQSIDAKLLSVLQVTTLNKGRNTPGMDKILAVSALQKMQLVESLELDGKALPIRRVWIPKPGQSEQRPLGIPTIKDRAKQALAKLALEPEWEAVFEPNSYGFRPGRSAQDAIEAIFGSLRHQTPIWVYDVDINKCFDGIDHDALLRKLDTFALLEKQVKAWLKARVMEALSLSDPPVFTTGTPQGGIISPLLANIALHGLENHLKSFVASLPMKPKESSGRGEAVKKQALSVIRYADDFVLIHVNKSILELCIEESKKWLACMGLEISEQKSGLRDGRQGFVFLGFQVIQIVKNGQYKVVITPSRDSQKSILLKVRNIIQSSKAASSYELISRLTPVIIGWANYFRSSECKQDFTKLSHLIFQKIRAWVFRRDPLHGRILIKKKYFPSGKVYVFDGREYKHNWVLNGDHKQKGEKHKKENFLPHMSWVQSRKHVKVQSTKSPFDSDSIYWSLRSTPMPRAPYSVRFFLENS